MPPPRRGIGERLRPKPGPGTAAAAANPPRTSRHAAIRSSTAPCSRTSSAASLGGWKLRTKDAVCACSLFLPSIAPSPRSLSLSLSLDISCSARFFCSPSASPLRPTSCPPFFFFLSARFAPRRISSSFESELAVVRGPNWIPLDSPLVHSSRREAQGEERMGGEVTFEPPFSRASLSLPLCSFSNPSLPIYSLIC